VARFIQRFGHEIDWQELPKRMKSYGLKYSVQASIKYCHYFFFDCFSPKIRNNLETFLRQNRLPGLSRDIIYHLADPRRPFDNRVTQSQWARRALALLLIQGLGRKISSIISKF